MIELLVVVAIIAVLVAVLLPAMAAARERTKLLVCGNQQRQMGSVTLMYAADSAGRWPPLNITYDPNTLDGDTPNWRWMLAKAYGMPYENTYPAFFHCPSSWNTDPKYWPYWCSYGGNGHLGTGMGSWWSFRTTDTVPYPITTMLFVDITIWQGRHAMNIWLPERDQLVAMWHGGRCSVVYCDGHVSPQDFCIQNPQLWLR